jgi:hypothetical protein
MYTELYLGGDVFSASPAEAPAPPVTRLFHLTRESAVLPRLGPSKISETLLQQNLSQALETRTPQRLRSQMDVTALQQWQTRLDAGN